jgi:hypothetical protein
MSEDGVIFNKTKTVLVVCPGGKQDYTIPNTVTEISKSAFGGKTSSVSIPNSVKSIGDYAFSYSTSLSNITVSWTQPLNLSIYVFDATIRESATLNVPAGTKANYMAANVWKEFKTIIEY